MKGLASLLEGIRDQHVYYGLGSLRLLYNESDCFRLWAVQYNTLLMLMLTGH